MNLFKEKKYYTKLEGLSRPIKKFLLYQSPLSKIVNTPFYDKIYLKRIKKMAKRIKPHILQIETTNACNARCLMCPHSIMSRKVETMSLADFKKILDNVIKNYHSIKRLTTNGFGEPLTDKGIMDKIKYVNQKYPKLEVDLYSNAGLLTPKISDQLLKRKLGRVTFSINGTKENYKEVMGLDYEVTQNNVLYFLKQRKKLNKKFLVNISMMILKENESKSKSFITFWEPWADLVKVYYPQDWVGELKDNLGDQKIPYGRKQWPCSAPWTHIVIHSAGDFVACCRDFNSAWPFGNLLKGQDIKEIRQSEKFQNFLKQQLNFNFEYPLCQNCDHAYDCSIEWWLYN